MTAIESYAFSGCDSLASLVIEDGVAAIGSNAFSNCDSLAAVTIPESVTAIESYAFSGCDTTCILTEAASVPSGWDTSWNISYCHVVWGYNGTQGETADGFGWIGAADGVHIVSYTGNATDLVVPDTIDGKAVIGIGQGVFAGLSGLRTLTLPFVGGDKAVASTIATPTTLLGYIFGTESYPGGVGAYQSFGAGGNSSVCYYIPETLKAVTVTGGHVLSYAFEDCELTTLKFCDGVDSIGWLFGYSSSVSTVVIESGVGSVESSAFRSYDHSRILYFEYESSAQFPDDWRFSWGNGLYGEFGISESGITEDGFCWVRRQDGIAIHGYIGTATEVAVPATIDGTPVYQIAPGAFYMNTDITSVTLPESVKRIHSLSFSGCEALTSVVISKGIECIYGYVFDGVGPIDLYYTGTEEDWAQIDINGDRLYNTTIHYNYTPEE